jgi:hypothetical protein
VRSGLGVDLRIAVQSSVPTGDSESVVLAPFQGRVYHATGSLVHRNGGCFGPSAGGHCHSSRILALIEKNADQTAQRPGSMEFSPGLRLRFVGLRFGINLTVADETPATNATTA